MVSVLVVIVSFIKHQANVRDGVSVCSVAFCL